MNWILMVVCAIPSDLRVYTVYRIPHFWTKPVSQNDRSLTVQNGCFDATTGQLCGLTDTHTAENLVMVG